MRNKNQKKRTWTHLVARLEGLEPSTLGLEGRCSIRLSYRRLGYSRITVAFINDCYCIRSIRFQVQLPIEKYPQRLERHRMLAKNSFE